MNVKDHNKNIKKDEQADKPGGHPEQTVTLNKEEYEKLKQEAADYKDKWVRLYAEFENVRKRFDRDKMEFTKYANEALVTEFLSILDDLERSVQAANTKHQDYESFLKGVELVMAHIYDLLKKNNVRPIESVGKPFDPHCQEVLLQEETETAQDRMVLEELQKGYYLGERVVRTAKVKVAVNKGKEKE